MGPSPWAKPLCLEFYASQSWNLGSCRGAGLSTPMVWSCCGPVSMVSLLRRRSSSGVTEVKQCGGGLCQRVEARTRGVLFCFGMPGFFVLILGFLLSFLPFSLGPAMNVHIIPLCDWTPFCTSFSLFFGTSFHLVTPPLLLLQQVPNLTH